MTQLTELAEFFPVNQVAAAGPRIVVSVPMQEGETYDQALARQKERTLRIQAQIIARKNQA